MAENGENRTRWHHLLGKLLEEALNPVGIAVYTDVSVMSDPPKADILLLRNEKREWTREQKARLPDGVRNSRADHILLEFKYTESVNKKAFLQTIVYDYLYKENRNLTGNQVRSFLISSKTPARKIMDLFGYSNREAFGVYFSSNILLKNIKLIALNELSDKPHNAFFKVFASRLSEKRTSIDWLLKNDIVYSNPRMIWLIEGLSMHWFKHKGGYMEDELTPEKVIEMGKKFHYAFLSALPPEELIKQYGKNRILSAIRTEDLLTVIKPEELLRGMKPEERLRGMKPEERLRGMTVQELESYLEKMKKSKK